MRIDARKGVVLFMVLAFVLLMSLTTVSFTTVLRQDIELIKWAKTKEQARNIAEAGINHAFARARGGTTSGFSRNLDTGSYTVTFAGPYSVDVQTDKFLIKSVGQVGDVSKEVSAEIRIEYPPSKYYICAAGNDIRIAALLALVPIVGDLHANNAVYLKGVVGGVGISGDVSGKSFVKEGSRLHNGDLLDILVWINGVNFDGATVYEGDDVPILTFPTFDYEAYKQEAIDSGDYYGTDHTFDTEDLAPSNGIVYVDGNAFFHGDCSLAGGIIADEIYIGERDGFSFINGSLEQTKTGHNRNVIIAKDGDIGVLGELEAEEAMIYGTQDVLSLENSAIIRVNGSLLAGRNLGMWSFWTIIVYNHVPIVPEDILDSEGNEPMSIISWNS